MGNCIVYAGFGTKCIAEVFFTAKVTKKNASDTSIILYTDSPLQDKYVQINEQYKIFDEIIIQELTQNLRAKPWAYRMVSMINITENKNYDKFLYLDTDASIVKEGGMDVFKVLDRFDIAVAHSQPEHRTVGKPIPEIPLAFPEFNCGVIAYKPSALHMLKNWYYLYTSGRVPNSGDQGAFRHAAYFSDLRIATLPPEYNNRYKESRSHQQCPECYIWHNRGCYRFYDPEEKPPRWKEFMGAKIKNNKIIESDEESSSSQ